ncbi:hypothetical protein N7468_010733 [Penicillium chermesinum]|uniref:Pathogenesis associated protein Cap20 n=1 Tax=Penicillium chermesinum TaxID=63820 RepID=A0A9W9N864_9EURO|nr:uncharacterized protein N7468_010733 [Penicillium chermesinum]KAJ5215054.1 hypothetical protein N7468_010733 [Penicillium chermesinum]
MAAEPVVNGEKVHSQFFHHLTSYPLVSDTINLFKTNPYGAKSLDLADQGFSQFAKPVLPYLSKPYSIIEPYLVRADSLGDQGLTRIDSRFPIIREDTQKIRGAVYNHATYPIRVADDVKQHVFDIYGTEYKKCGGDGYVASGKAVITSSLVLTQESLAWVNTWFQTAKEEVKEVVNDKNSH